jgi:3-hydroxyisobutyrate dehydrogenase-like beta-hydroxyacid dehydrogenase
MANDRVLGFIGLGSMGGAMVQRLIGAQHKVVAYDVSQDATAAVTAAGGQGAASVAELVGQCDIVFMSLPTPQVVSQVALGGAFARGGRTRIVVDLSTTGPRMSGEVAQAMGDMGIVLVDSPVSGGRAAATGGRLALMAACDPSVWGEVEPLLAHFGKVFYVGAAPGQAQTMKLINNMLSVAALAVTSEGFALGVKVGLDPQVMVDVINASSGVNSATRDKFPRAVLPRTFDFGFSTGLSLKDLRLGLEEAERQGVPTIIGSAARAMMEITQSRFGAQSDFTNIARVVEEWAGVEIKARPPA